MERFNHTVLISFTTWLIAALINGLLVSAWLILSNGSGPDGIWGTFMLVVVFSLLFSIPGMFVFWILFVANYYRTSLFRVMLTTALLASSLSVFIFFKWIGKSLRNGNFLFVLFAVVSAVCSLLIHHASIRNIINQNNDYDDI